MFQNLPTGYPPPSSSPLPTISKSPTKKSATRAIHLLFDNSTFTVVLWGYYDAVLTVQLYNTIVLYYIVLCSWTVIKVFILTDYRVTTVDGIFYYRGDFL